MHINKSKFNHTLLKCGMAVVPEQAFFQHFKTSKHFYQFATHMTSLCLLYSKASTNMQENRSLNIYIR